MVMANRNVHVFGNRLSGNGTSHVLIAAYPNEYEDDSYMFVPRGVFVHGNEYGEGGNAPDGEVGKDHHRCFRRSGSRYRLGRGDAHS